MKNWLKRNYNDKPIYITRNVFHFPDFCRQKKITARIIQSQTIAMAIPITPIFRTIPKNQDSSRRTTIVDITETYMVNFTSPAARSLCIPISHALSNDCYEHRPHSNSRQSGQRPDTLCNAICRNLVCSKKCYNTA